MRLIKVDVSMDVQFWVQRWEKNQTSFHEKETNGLLLRYWDQLALPEESRVFVPLCGKTRDIAWLLGNGYRVIGAELSQEAVEQLFAELGVMPEVTSAGELKRYAAGNLVVFVGDFFDLTAELIGPVDAVYDRAALVAMPESMRTQYTEKLMSLTGCANQFLLCFEHDQSLMDGPPFSIESEQLAGYYKSAYQLSQIASREIPGGLKGVCAASETAWLVRKHA